jgi:CRP/FNR family cyclic AMP-dependent transcriptional regulator
MKLPLFNRGSEASHTSDPDEQNTLNLAKNTPALDQQDLLRGLNEQELKIFHNHLKQEHYPANTLIIQEGKKAHRLYIIKSGDVLISKTGHTSEQEDIPISKLTQGECFGEFALLSLEENQRTANVRALSETQVYCLHRDDFEKLMHVAPQLYSKLLKNLSNTLGSRLKNATISTVTHLENALDHAKYRIANGLLTAYSILFLACYTLGSSFMQSIGVIATPGSWSGSFLVSLVAAANAISIYQAHLPFSDFGVNLYYWKRAFIRSLVNFCTSNKFVNRR